MKKYFLFCLVITLMLFNSCSKDGGGTPNLKIGSSFQGGIVIYLLQPEDAGYEAGAQHGIIVSETDAELSTWGCKGTAITGADAKTVGSGITNTTEILAGCNYAFSAAKICSDFTVTDAKGNTYDDWYLPSLWELDLLGAASNEVEVNSGNYWSSSEASSDFAWFNDVSLGVKNTAIKDTPCRIRPFRSF